MEGARALFTKLTGQEAKGAFQRVVLKDGREVVFRATSRSGPVRVEIIDHKKKLLEKISFPEPR